MEAKFLILERTVQNDLETICSLYKALGSPDLEESTQERLIVAGYWLHRLYLAFENTFRNIAAVFEDPLQEQSGWSWELLQRMRLDLTPIRPAVIDAEAYEKLDELLRFRHVFRTLYGVDLDPLRLRIVVRRALELEPLYRVQIG